MNAKDLALKLATLAEGAPDDGPIWLDIEVATSPRKDEWYTIADIEIDENHRGKTVIVIHTD